MNERTLVALVLTAALCAPLQAASFSQNEVRAARVRDGLGVIRATLREGERGSRRFSASVAAAFRGEPDWAKASESYYSIGAGLLARAAALESRLEKAASGNSFDAEDRVAREMESVWKTSQGLRADFEFYAGLPALASGPRRGAVQATMRLLAQTGDFPVAIAYYDSRESAREPFTALPPAALLARPVPTARR